MAKNHNAAQSDGWNQETRFGANMSFAASEAYKLLRTNITFSFPAEGRSCHVIGVTSTVSSEGKSMTACNLAYSLAEAGKKTLLIDGDLRLPTVATKLELPPSPGLSNLLISDKDHRTVIRPCAAMEGMDVLCAGDITPNPSELLGSARMAQLLEALSKTYEYIIIDLPPVTVVTDALAMAKLLHGVIMVVRNGVVEQRALADAMRQMDLVGLRVLGFVYNGSRQDSTKRYYRGYEKAGRGKKRD